MQSKATMGTLPASAPLLLSKALLSPNMTCFLFTLSLMTQSSAMFFCFNTLLAETYSSNLLASHLLRLTSLISMKRLLGQRICSISGPRAKVYTNSSNLACNITSWTRIIRLQILKRSYHPLPYQLHLLAQRVGLLCPSTCFDWCLTHLPTRARAK